MTLVNSAPGIKMREYTTSNEVMRSNIGRFVVKKAEGNKGLRQIGMLGAPRALVRTYSWLTLLSRCSVSS
jgi:hypothetical protein